MNPCEYPHRPYFTISSDPWATLLYAADSLGLSSFNYLWWAPKDMCLSHNSRSRSIHGHPKLLMYYQSKAHRCDFLLVITSNLGPILVACRSKSAKIASLYPPQSHKLSSLGVTAFEFRDEPDILNNQNVQALQRGRNHVASFHHFDTDGQTDGHFCFGYTSAFIACYAATALVKSLKKVNSSLSNVKCLISYTVIFVNLLSVEHNSLQ